MGCGLAASAFLLTGPVLAAGRKLSATIDVTVFKCAQPVNEKCVATKEEDKARCPSCQVWVPARVKEPVSTVLNDRTYPGAQNNYFLRDVTKQVYEVDYPRTAEGKPVKVSELYKNPKKYGWVEVPSDQPKAGTIAVWGKVAGVVKGGSGGVSATIRTDSLSVLHASDARGGEVVADRAQDLFKKGKPKFLLPEALLERLRSLFWNHWFEASSDTAIEEPSFQPTPVEPGGTYRLVLDLAALEYGGASQDPIGKTLVETLALRLASSKAPEAHLTALLLPDPRYFAPPARQAKPLTLRLAALRAWVAQPSLPTGDPLEALRQAADFHAPFEFGWVSFPVATRQKSGKTTIGIVLWDETGHALGEIVVPVCIATEQTRAAVCPGEPAIRHSLSGLDSTRLGTSLDPGPDAALVFAELGNLTGGQGVVGVFHRKDGQNKEFLSWSLDIDAETLGDHLKDIATDIGNASIAKNYDEKALASEGEKLFRELFLADDEGRDSPDSKVARQAFREFFEIHRTPPASGALAPSLFVRVLPSLTHKRPLLLPLGLLAVPAAPDATGASPLFLGYSLRIETPLAYQSYTLESDCISRWRLVLPPADAKLSDLAAQRVDIDRDLQSWEAAAEVPPSMSKFREWLGEPKNEADSAALVIFSHHGNVNDVGKLQFKTQEPDTQNIIKSDDVRRSFLKPSLAILNGCGSAEPEAEAFVDSFNEHGIETVIATKNTVSPEMAVDFFRCLSGFLNEVEARSPVERPKLAAVHFDAVRCLATEKTDPQAIPYGARALAYSLLGNGGLVLCPPAKPTAPGGTR